MYANIPGFMFDSNRVIAPTAILQKCSNNHHATILQFKITRGQYDALIIKLVKQTFFLRITLKKKYCIFFFILYN